MGECMQGENLLRSQLGAECLTLRIGQIVQSKIKLSKCNVARHTVYWPLVFADI